MTRSTRSFFSTMGWVSCLCLGLVLVSAINGHGNAHVAALPDVQLRSGDTINALVTLPDGTVIIGGDFEWVNGVPRNNLARLLPDGSLDLVWTANTDQYGAVNALALDGDDLYVGGFFSFIGGLALDNLAKIDLSQGDAVDPTWQPNPDDEVEALWLDNSHLYVGGGFTTIGGVTQSFLARLFTSNGTVDSFWSHGANDQVRAIHVTGTWAYVGGDFTSIGGENLERLVRIGITPFTATVDTNWAPLPDQRVNAIWVTNGFVYAGGAFTSIGSEKLNYLARLPESKGGKPDTFWIPELDDEVLVCYADDNHAYLGGAFQTVNKLPQRFLARVEAANEGQTDQSWHPDVFGGKVRALAIQSSTFLIGGDFVGVDGRAALGIAKLETVTGKRSPFVGSVEKPATVHELLRQADGSLVVAGAFSAADDYLREGLLRLKPDGTVDADWDPFLGTTPGVTIYALGRSGSDLIVGGDFTHVGGQAHPYLAKFSSAGTGMHHATWFPNPSARVDDLAISGTEAVICGPFNLVNGLARPQLAKVSTLGSGAVDAGWNPNLSNGVSTVVIDYGFVYIGGSFISTAPNPQAYLARVGLGGSGVVDASWNPASNGRVTTIAIQGTDLFCAGAFTLIGGRPLAGLAQVDIATGASNPLWNPAPNGPVHAINPGTASVFVGGAFTQISGVSRFRISKLVGTSGFSDLNWRPASESDVRAMVLDQGSVYVGGSFTNITSGVSVLRRGLARILTNALPPSIVTPPASQSADQGDTVEFEVAVSGSEPMTYQWLKNGVAIPGETARRLRLSNVNPADDGNYSVFVSNPLGNLFSASGALTVTGIPQVPSIVSGPVSTNVRAGANITFSVTATGSAPLSYFWFRDGALFQAGGSPDYAIVGADLSHQGTYVVIVSNALGVVYSQPAVLTVNLDPQIIQGPQDVTVVLGETATFEVVVEGSQPLSYQWRLNNTNILGATGSILEIVNVQTSDAGFYDVFVTNQFGVNTSESVQLTVLVPPVIITQPDDVTANIGDGVTLCASAVGSGPLIYQWRKNGENIPGATDNCYAIANVGLSDGGLYTVVVANEAGAETSDPALVSVSLSQVQAGDDFGESTAFDELQLRGTNAGATKEPNEPDHAGNEGGRSVWYSRTVGASGIATIRTTGSAFDTLLAVYVGDSIDNLTLIASDEDQGSYFSSEVRFGVQEGNTYHIVVDGYNGVSGEFLLEWELEITSDPLPVIVTPPQSQTVAPGSNATFSVTASGSSLAYQWYFNGAALAGETGSTLEIVGVDRHHVGRYTVEVSNDVERSVTSNPAVLEIGLDPLVQTLDKIPNPLVGSTSPLKGGAASTLPANSTGGGFGVTVAAGTISSQVFNNTDDTTQAGEPNHCGVLGGSTRWLVLNTTAAGLEFTIDSVGSDIDTVLAVYSRSSLLSPLVEVTCDSSALSDGGAPSVTFPAMAGLDYWIAVDGVGGVEGVIQLNWRLGSFPDVNSNGQDQTVVLGSTLSWLLEVSGDTPTATIQWRKDGVIIPDATTLGYNLTGIGGGSAGLYSVMVSNLMGVSEFNVALVTVDLFSRLLAESTFETGNDEWVIELSDGLRLPTHQPPAGLQDGFVRFGDEGLPDIWYWSAPLSFLGNKVGAYDGRLEFDQFQDGASAGFADGDIILEGNGMRLVHKRLFDPDATWASYSVTIEESGWHIGGPDGPVPTRLQLLEVLQDLTGLFIRGDFTSAIHESGLNNVRLVAPVQTDVTLLGVQRLNSTQLVLEWPENASGFQLQSSPGLIPGAWTPLLEIPVLTNGFRRVLLPSGVGGFYRLEKP